MSLKVFRFSNPTLTITVSASQQGVVECLFDDSDKSPNDRPETPWQKKLYRKLSDYVRGKVVDLGDIPLDFTFGTPFQQDVYNKLRTIGFGQMVTYGELAEKIGRPGAARAVGTAMKNNRIPLFIPCHRVIGSGRLGGFSANGGTELKRKLLAHEGVNLNFSKTQKPRSQLV